MRCNTQPCSIQRSWWRASKGKAQSSKSKMLLALTASAIAFVSEDEWEIILLPPQSQRRVSTVMFSQRVHIKVVGVWEATHRLIMDQLHCLVLHPIPRKLEYRHLTALWLCPPLVKRTGRSDLILKTCGIHFVVAEQGQGQRDHQEIGRGECEEKWRGLMCRESGQPESRRMPRSKGPKTVQWNPMHVLHMCTQKHTDMPMCTCTRTHKNAHIHTYTRTHIHTYTHTPHVHAHTHQWRRAQKALCQDLTQIAQSDFK